MRKTIIALMLVLPLLFVFAVFSSVNIASLGVEIAANGISIVNKSELGDGSVRIDLASYNAQKLEVAVSPENATNKGYTFRVEEVEGSDFADVTVSDDGVISASSEGAARIYAVSNDGGYRDSVTVLVGSSKAYDFDFKLFDSEGEVELLTDANGNYSASVSTGRFTYATKIYPSGFTVANVQVNTGSIAFVEAGSRSILIPFSGTVVLSVTVPDGVNGDIIKTVTLTADKSSTSSGFTVNGAQGNIIALAEGAKNASFYVESNGIPSLTAEFGIQDVSITKVNGTQNGYLVYVTLMDNLISDFSATLSVDGVSEEISFTFKTFDFSLGADLDIDDSGYSSALSMLNGTPVTFYAVAAVSADDVTYVWGVESLSYDGSILSPSDTGATCVVNTSQNGSFVLWVEAYRDGMPTGLVKEVTVSVISRVYGVQIANDTSADLAARYTVGGLKYNEQGQTINNRYLLDVRTFYDAQGSGELSVDDLNFAISDESKAAVQVDASGVWLVPLGDGEVTVSFSWKGNQTFGTNYSASLTVNVLRNAIEVDNAPDLVTATKAGLQVVLTDDIMLGTDKDGNVLDIATRRSMLGSMKSTYNIEWYKNKGIESEAYVKYVIEFKDDVFGNGHFINAEHFTNAKDGTGTPLLYMGPLYLVNMGNGTAYVSGQDNIAFLIRTDGVTLYGVNLLGCSDESLKNDSGEYDLVMLNSVGNVLEVNADADIVNCRIRNGRNVVRTYGGNRDGNKYFIESLSENANGVSEDDRINVRIEGCVISQGREFLVKVGANRALQALAASGGEEPSLCDQNGNPYDVQTNKYLNDEYFYKMYVMTDLTLKDSVLETSGLFAIGVETNFSGAMLYKDMEVDDIIGGTEEWLGAGGTSFASVIRMEGDVRIYDWKDISLVDSSTLIQSGGVLKDWLHLNIAAMIEHVQQTDAEKYGTITGIVDGKTYVHGGMAFYGGGKNYSQITFENMDTSVADYSQYNINITVLASSSDNTLSIQGSMLPAAAGSQDFRFYMYNADSANNYSKQVSDASSGAKYSGVKSINVF